MKKKIVMGLFVLATVIGMGFAEETKSSDYYKGYNQATLDYSKDNDYRPSWCDINASNGKSVKEKQKNKYDCIQGYQDSWERNNKVAPKTQTENNDSENTDSIE